MMKFVTSLACFLLLLNCLHAQQISDASKEETIAWILSKFQAYAKFKQTFNTSKSEWTSSYSGNSGGGYGDPKEFEGDASIGFTNGFFTVSITYVHDIEITSEITSPEYRSKYSYSTETKQYVESYKIPIYSISNVSGVSEIYIETNCACIESSNGKTSTFYTSIPAESEQNLTDRMRKAFLHLKTFYEDPHSGEKF